MSIIQWHELELNRPIIQWDNLLVSNANYAVKFCRNKMSIIQWKHSEI